MKCPMLVEDKYFDGEKDQLILMDCLKEECGFWDKDHKNCSELGKVRELQLIRSLLREIRDKMPHAGQFTK